MSQRRFRPEEVIGLVAVPGGRTKKKKFFVLSFDGNIERDKYGNFAYWSFNYPEVDALCYQMERALESAEENDMY